MAARTKLRFYRVWCGRKCYSAWLPDRDDAFTVAEAYGLAYRTGDTISLGPLTWIEMGERTYARSRTIPISSK